MEDNIKNKETDPVSGRELSNLTNYNQGDPVNTEPISMEEFYKKYSPNNEVIGGSGSVETVDYSPSKFDTSIFINELPNVEHLRSQNQGVLSTLGRSGANFFGQTLVNVAGGVVGTAYGGASAIINGDHTKLWDNEIMEALDTASEYIREDLFKVYNSNDYEGRNLVQRMLLNPAQFSYDLLDTLSFTAGAVITEYLTAGMASAAIAPKALRYLKKLGQGTKSAEVAGKLGSTSAQLFSGAMKGGTLARQLWTGAGYEAMVESRQTVLEARENMLQDWLSDNPEYTIDNIPDEIRQEIDDSLSNMGLLSFIANMSLVGFSNMAQFPTVFRNSFNDSRKGLWRRIGRNESGDYYDKITDLTKAQRFARSAATFLKNPFLEGVVEEGGQTVISGLSQEYFDRKNNIDSKEESVDFLSALANNIIDTYTSAEGWEEIGMGIIVGSIGGPGRGLIPGRSGVDPSTGERGSLWTGGIYGEFQQRGEVDNKVDGIVKILNDNPNILDNIKANFDYMVKAHSIDKEQNYHLAAGDIFNFKNRQDDKVHAYIMSRIDAGLQSDLQTTVEELQAMDAEVLYKEFKGDEADANASESEKLEFKESLINEYQQKIDKTIEAHDIVNRSSVVDNNDNLREYLTHALSVANYMDIREDNINKELAKLTNNIIGSSVSLESKTTLIPMQQEINSIKKELTDPELDSLSKAALQSLLNKLEKELASLKDSSFSLMASDYSQLREFAKRDPVQFAATLTEVLPLLRDASKVKDYRQELIDNFNRYFTVEGAKEFKKLEKKVNEERERIERERQETEAKEQREQERKNNIEKAKAKTKKKVTPETSEKDTPETTEEDTAPETEIETPETTETGEDVEELQPVEEKVPEEVIDGEQTEETLKNNIESIKENIQDANDLLDNPTLPESIKEPITTQKAELEAELESLERQLEELESVQEEDIPEAEDSEPESPEQEAESLLAEREVKNEQIEDFEDETEITSPVDDNSRNKLIEELKDLPIYNTIKRGFGAVLAYLNVSKKEHIQASGAIRLVDQYDEAGELLIEDNVDSRILSPKHFNVGDVLSMRPVTYQEIQERGEGEYTEEDFKRDSNSVDTFPIGIFDSDNKLIGFYPTRDNIHRNTNSEYKSRFLLENREHRTRIFENPNNIFSTTITAKTPGVPAFNKITNQKPLLEVLGDGNKISDNIELAIAKTISVNQKGATLFNSNSKSRGRVTKTLSAPNTSLMSGFLYAVVPSAVDKVYIPVPLNVNGIGQTNAEVLTEALRLFATTNRTESDLKSINTISEEFDITTLTGLRDFINKFTYSSSSNNNDTNTVRILENRLLLSPTNSEVNFTMEEIAESEEVRKTIASVLANRFPTVKLSEINNKESFISYTLGEDGVIQRVENDNFQSYLSNNEIVTTSLHGVDIGDGEKAFGMQPVIALSDPVKGEEFTREDNAAQKQESFTESNKDIIEETGDLIYNESTPQQKQQKQGVSELFESNPELANEIYEVVGLGTNTIEKNIENTVTESLKEKIFRLGEVPFEKTEFEDINVHVQKINDDEFSIAVDNKGRNIFGLLSAVLDFQRRDLDSDSIYSPNPKGFILWETFLNSEVASTPKAKVIVDNRFSIALGALKALKNNGVEYIHFPERFTEDFKKEYSQFLKQDFSSVGFTDVTGSMLKTVQFSIDDLIRIISLKSNNQEITPQQKQQVQQLYAQYLDTIFPDSKVKDIVYHHSSQKLENFDKSFLGKETSAPDTQLGFFFAEDKNDIPKMVVEKNKQLEEIGAAKRLNFSVQNNVLLNIKNPEYYYGFIEEAVSNVLGREARVTSITAKQDYKEARLKLESNNKDSLIYGLTVEPDGEGGTDVNKGYVVFEPEQIHILGSKQDIQGFKEFVGKTRRGPKKPKRKLGLDLNRLKKNKPDFNISLSTENINIETENKNLPNPLLLQSQVRSYKELIRRCR